LARSENRMSEWGEEEIAVLFEKELDEIFNSFALKEREDGIKKLRSLKANVFAPANIASRDREETIWKRLISGALVEIINLKREGSDQWDTEFICNRLLLMGADPNFPIILPSSSSYRSPLFCALQWYVDGYHVEGLTTNLIEYHGAQFNPETDGGWGRIMQAISTATTHTKRLVAQHCSILEPNAPINESRDTAFHPLGKAMFNLEDIDSLLKMRVDPRIKNNRGEDAADAMKSYKYKMPFYSNQNDRARRFMRWVERHEEGIRVLKAEILALNRRHAFAMASIQQPTLDSPVSWLSEEMFPLIARNDLTYRARHASR